MSFFKHLKNIRNNKFPEVILLYGMESYFIKNLKDELIKQVIQEDHDNLSTYDLKEIPIEEVLNDVETYPFFGERKLVIAHHPLFLTNKREKLPFEHNLQAFEKYLENPVDYSVLLLILESDAIDRRRKLTKLIQERALVIECHPIKAYEVEKWIKNFAKDLKITISEDAFPLLMEEFIPNLYMIQNELLKLSTYVGEGGEVTREIAEKLISRTEESSAFRLMDAVIKKDLSHAISVYKDLRKLNEEPIGLLALLASQFRIILQVKLLRSKGFSPHQITQQIKAHSFVIRMASKRERLFSVNQLKMIMDHLASADAAIKQGKMNADLAVELLLRRMILRMEESNKPTV